MAGALPRTRLGNLQRSPNILAGFKRAVSQQGQEGREGKGRRRGNEGEEGRRKGQKGKKGREGEGREDDGSREGLHDGC